MVERLLWRLELLCQLDRSPEEFHSHERRLPALPGHGHLRSGLVRFEELADVELEDIVAHSEAIPRIERLFGEEEAVLAIEVADRPSRLDQHVERRWGGERPM